MIIDISPLLKHRDYRWLFFGQLISMLGSCISWVATPFYLYDLTKSNAKVGLLGIVSLVPLVLFGIWGGALADKLNRKRMIITCEVLLAALFTAFAFLIQNHRADEVTVFAFTFITSCLAGFHRPALESLTPLLVNKEDIPRVSSLQGFRGTFAHIIGPAIGGLLIAGTGAAITFYIDAASYLLSALCMLSIHPPKRALDAAIQRLDWNSIKEGFRYAAARPAIFGTYIMDILAMTFCFPIALFPAIAEMSGGATKLGPLYSSMSVGALIATIFSSWTYRQRRHGMMVSLGGIGWCLGVAAFAALVMQSYWIALAFLAIAGYADMISVMFRFTIWNELIPDSHRGRLAGIEMISYMTGPLLGNTILGYLAEWTSPVTALSIGSAVGFICISLATFWLKPFWIYFASERKA